MTTKRRVRLQLKLDFLVHTISRVGSGLLSFLMFSLVAKLFAVDLTKRIYFFIFVFGFFASALRALAMISASLDPAASKTQRYRRLNDSAVLVGAGAIVLLVPAISIFVSQSIPPGAIAVAVIVLLVCGIDIDMLRATLGRTPLVGTATALGTAAAVLWLLSNSPPDAHQIFVAVLLQWIPVCVLNIWAVRRHWHSTTSIRLRRLKETPLRVTMLLFIALFDGIILNFPFLLGQRIPSWLGLDIAVVARLFVASLVLVPLANHWSNSSALSRISARMRMSVKASYLTLLFAPGIISGALFALAYTTLSGMSVRPAQLIAFAILLAAYCTYASAARFQGAVVGATRVLILILVALMMASTVVLLLKLHLADVVTIVGSQAAALLIGAWILQRTSSVPSHAPPT